MGGEEMNIIFFKNDILIEILENIKKALYNLLGKNNAILRQQLTLVSWCLWRLKARNWKDSPAGRALTLIQLAWDRSPEAYMFPMKPQALLRVWSNPRALLIWPQIKQQQKVNQQVLAWCEKKKWECWQFQVCGKIIESF